MLVTLAIVGAFLFAIGWIAGWPVRPSLKDFALWVASGLVYGALIGLGAYLFALLQPYAERTDFKLSLPIIFGIPWVLMSQLIAEMIFVGLVSYELDSDSDREWLGRAAGWISAVAIGWAVTAFLSVGIGNLAYQNSFHYDLGRYITALGGVSGIATALLGDERQDIGDNRRQPSELDHFRIQSPAVDRRPRLCGGADRRRYQSRSTFLCSATPCCTRFTPRLQHL